MALRAVHQYPGCSAWALWVILETPSGFSDGERKALLWVGQKSGLYGVERVSYWPASYEVPEWAGELVTADEAAERDSG